MSSENGPASTFVAVSLLTLATRLPFLFAGYGTDWDAWRLVSASRQIADSGSYVVSRFPGHPLPEFMGALLHTGGPLALNGAVACMSALSCGFFALIWRRLSGHSPIAAGLALAFIPVVFLNSVNAMDHVWALAFTMLALHLAIAKRPLAAGIALGLALGCRPNSLIILPTLIWVAAWRENESPRWQSAAALSLGAFFVGGLLFLPVIATYGLDFLTVYDVNPVQFFVIAKRASLDVWGGAGFIAFMAFTLSSVFSKPRPGSVRLTYAWWLALATTALAFLGLPQDPGYLIPALPFALLLLLPYLSSIKLQFLTSILLVSCFFFSITSDRHVSQFGGARFFPFSEAAWHLDTAGGGVMVDLLGPLLLEERRRKAEVAYTREVLEQLPKHVASSGDRSRLAVDSPPLHILIAGDRRLSLEAFADSETRRFWRFAEGLTASELKGYAADGVAVYHLPGTSAPNSRKFGVDPIRFGAQPLFD